MRKDSDPRGHEFKFLHWILDGSFFTFTCSDCLEARKDLKNAEETVDGPFQNVYFYTLCVLAVISYLPTPTILYSKEEIPFYSKDMIAILTKLCRS